MSDYVHKKSVMYPIWDQRYSDIIYEKLNSKFIEISSFHDTNYIGFEIEWLDDGEHINYYLSYVLFYTYGEDSGDFGTSRSLTKDEENYWVERFSVIWKDIFECELPNPNWLKFVDYCHYNACECFDYYTKSDIEENTIELDKPNAERFNKFLEN